VDFLIILGFNTGINLLENINNFFHKKVLGSVLNQDSSSMLGTANENQRLILELLEVL